MWTIDWTEYEMSEKFYMITYTKVNKWRHKQFCNYTLSGFPGSSLSEMESSHVAFSNSASLDTIQRSVS
jgi:hypothetical protein